MNTKLVDIPTDAWKEIKASGHKLCKSDNLYQAYYRYLQSKWRMAHNIPVKKQAGQSDIDVYGNYITDP